MNTIMTITHKGQVTFPKALLAALGISVGDRIAVTVQDSKAIVEPLGGGILDLIGTLPKLKLPKGKTVDDLINQSRLDHAKKILH